MVRSRAAGSAVCAALTSILAVIGIEGQLHFCHCHPHRRWCCR
ncbi:MAG: hypothetical protein ACLVJH_13020 [Faecalibacterium prausnitzii]